MLSALCCIEEKDEMITCDVELGGGVEQAVEEAVRLSRSFFKKVCFEVNDITIQVEYYTIADAAIRDYYRALSGLIPKNIGPDCEYPLSTRSILEDKEILQKRRQ